MCSFFAMIVSWLFRENLFDNNNTVQVLLILFLGYLQQVYYPISYFNFHSTNSVNANNIIYGFTSHILPYQNYWRQSYHGKQSCLSRNLQIYEYNISRVDRML